MGSARVPAHSTLLVKGLVEGSCHEYPEWVANEGVEVEISACAACRLEMVK